MARRPNHGMDTNPKDHYLRYILSQSMQHYKHLLNRIFSSSLLGRPAKLQCNHFFNGSISIPPIYRPATQSLNTSVALSNTSPRYHVAMQLAATSPAAAFATHWSYIPTEPGKYSHTFLRTATFLVLTCPYHFTQEHLSYFYFNYMNISRHNSGGPSALA